MKSKAELGEIVETADGIEGTIYNNDVAWTKKNISDLLINYQDTPKELHKAILNNGGQHYNHSLY